jgi:hypothetical protein
LPFDALTIAINLTMAMELSQIPLLMGWNIWRIWS